MHGNLQKSWSKLPPKHSWANSEALMLDKQRRIFAHHNPQIMSMCYCTVTGEKLKQAMWIFAVHRPCTSDSVCFYQNSSISPTHIQRGRSVEHGLRRCDPLHPLHHDQKVFLLGCGCFNNWCNPWMRMKMHLNTLWPGFPSVDVSFCVLCLRITIELHSEAYASLRISMLVSPPWTLTRLVPLLNFVGNVTTCSKVISKAPGLRREWVI